MTQMRLLSACVISLCSLFPSAGLCNYRIATIDGTTDGPTVAVICVDPATSNPHRFAIEQMADIPIDKGKLILAVKNSESPVKPSFDLTDHWKDSASSLKDIQSAHNPDLLLLLTEDYDFHASIPASFGNTVIPVNGDNTALLAASICREINREISHLNRKWKILTPEKHTRLNHTSRLNTPSLLITTSNKCQNKKQPLSLRSRHCRQAVATVLAELGVISDKTSHRKLTCKKHDNQLCVAVYDGPGAVSSSGHDPAWIRQSLAHLPIQVMMIGLMDVREGELTPFDVVIFGGGSSYDQGESLGEIGRRSVCTFIEKGGGYVGICAGAFLAMAEKDYQLGLVDASLSGGSANSIVDLTFSDDAQNVLKVDTIEKTKLSGGPIYNEKTIPENCRIWASFTNDLKYKGKMRDYKNRAAILAATHGKGRLVLFSPHCERYPGPQNAFWNSLFWAGCKESAQEKVPEQTRVDLIRKALLTPYDPSILIVAHRGFHFEQPENSIPAIEDSVQAGAHIVEIDIRKTADGKYYLMHDSTVNRTTYSKGKFAEFTEEEVRQLQLRKEARPTSCHPPSLDETFEAAHDKIMLNLDMKSVSIREMVEIARAKDMIDHCLFKQWWHKLTKDEIDWLSNQPDVIFMPLVKTPEEARLVIKETPFRLLEVIYDSSTWKPEDLTDLQKKGARLWANSLREGPKGLKLGDRQAVHTPRKVFTALHKMGFTMIQTDLPDTASTVLGDFTRLQDIAAQ